MFRHRWFFVLMVCGLLLSGCAGDEPGGTLSAAPKVQSGGTLYFDDFSDDSSGWDTWSDEKSQAAYDQGGLRMRVSQANYDTWSRPGRRYGDARIAVDTTRLGGPDNNNYGILCRYSNRSNFYALVISSDGYAGILKVKEGKYQILSGEALSYQEAVRQGGEMNVIGAECVGDRLALYANGNLLLEAQDADFSDGEVGLIAGSFDETGVDILFDNFYVIQP